MNYMEKYLIDETKKEIEKNRAEYIFRASELYEQNHSLEELIPAIKEYLGTHYDQFKELVNPQSILESRFTPPREAFAKGMKSCGVITNIVAEMLREIGFEVKKIHGSVPQSNDHAWIKVKDPNTNIWKQYDLTFPSCEVTSKHKIISECNEWSEIDEQIQDAHKKD